MCFGFVEVMMESFSRGADLHLRLLTVCAMFSLTLTN
jgi:hypothetical protein